MINWPITTYHSNGEMIISLIKESPSDGFLGKIMVLISKFKNISNRFSFFEKKPVHLTWQSIKNGLQDHFSKTINLSFSPQHIMTHIFQKSTETFSNNGRPQMSHMHFLGNVWWWEVDNASLFHWNSRRLNTICKNIFQQWWHKAMA